MMREIVREAKRNGRKYDRGNYAGRKLRISALDIILVSIAAVLLVGIVVLAFDLDVRELPKSVSVIWWSLVSVAGAWIASLGM